MKTWTQVAESPEFGALSEADKEGARQQYFEQVVRPRLGDDEVEEARAQFDADTRRKPKEPDWKEGEAGGGRGFVVPHGPTLRERLFDPSVRTAPAHTPRRGGRSEFKPFVATGRDTTAADVGNAVGGAIAGTAGLAAEKALGTMLDLQNSEGREPEPPALDSPLAQPAAYTPSRTELLAGQSLRPEVAQRIERDARPPAEAKPFTTGQNLAADVREATKNPVARGVAQGVGQIGQIGPGALRLAADFFGSEKLGEFASAAGKTAGQFTAGATSDLRGGEKLVADVTGSILNSAPSMALGVMGGPALKTLFVQSTLSEYNAGRDAGFGPEESLQRAGIMGAAEAVGERFGFPQQIALLKSLAKHVPTDRLSKVFGEMLAKEIPGEQLTTLMQFVADKAGPAALNPDATLADYLDQAGETLKVTIAQTGVMGGGPAAIGVTRNALRQADQAAGAAPTPTPIDPAAILSQAIDDAAAQYGLSPRATAAVRDKAMSMPADQAPAFVERALQGFEKANLVKKPGAATGFRQALDAKAQEALDSQETEAPAEQPSQPRLDAGSILAGDDFTGLDTAAVSPAQDQAGGSPAEGAGATQPTPAPAPVEGEPPLAPGFVRLYHGGVEMDDANSRWVAPGSLAYAEGYAGKTPGGQVLYADIPETDPRLQKAFDDEGTSTKAPYVSFALTGDEAANMKPLRAPASIEGEPINRNWSAFTPESGTLGIPREQMPQVKAEHRGALTNFLNARGITHESDEVPADSLKPTQGEFSPRKVKQAAEFTGGNRAVLVSADGFIIDGTHQWAAAREAGEQIKVIRFDAPIQDLLRLAQQFPSSFSAGGARRAGPGPAEPGRVEEERPDGERSGRGEPLVQGELQQPLPTGVAGQPVPGDRQRDVPAPTRPGDGDKALSPGDAVTLEGKPFTGKSATPRVIRLTDPAGKVRVISSDSDNWPKIQRATAEPPAPAKRATGAPAETFAGQRGEGMSEFVAKQHLPRLRRERPDLEWSIAEADPQRNPKYKPDRFVVEGRAASAASQQSAAATTGGANEVAQPDTSSSEARVGVPAPQPARKTKAKAPRTKTTSPVVGSMVLGEIVHRLGGIGMGLRSDLSSKALRERVSKTGKKTQYTAWRGDGMLFRKTGSTDLTEMARVLEEAGYIEPGTLERDYLEATSQVQDIIKAEIANPGSTEPVYAEGYVEAQGRQREADEREQAEAEDAAALDEWLSGELDVQAADVPTVPEAHNTALELARLLDEAADAGVDVDALKENFFEQSDPEWSQDTYDANLAQILADAAAGARGQARRDDAGTAGADDQLGRQAGGDQDGPPGDGPDGPDGALRPEQEAGEVERFAAGRALTKEQRKTVLRSLVDVYKAKRAPRELKGLDRNGNERSGYVHSPELFEKSDITGAMVRYYVTLPDGRIAHPSELFPNYTQADIDRALIEQESAERIEREEQARWEQQAERFGSASPEEAKASFMQRNKGFELRDWRTGKVREFAVMTKGGKFYATISDDTSLIGRLERAGWVRADRPALTLTAETEADAQAKADREARADELDERAQIDREADEFRLNAGPAVEQRKDSTGDLLGGPSTSDLQAAAERDRAKKATAPGGPDLFGFSDAESKRAANNAEDLRRQLIGLEDRIIGMAGVGKDLLEDALRSRKVPADLKRQRDELRQALADAREQAWRAGGLAAKETQGAYSTREPDPYETDLFGNPLPAAAGKPGRRQASAGRTEDRPAPGGVPGDTPAPAGEYLTRTVVGVATQRQVGAAKVTDAESAAAATAYLGGSAVERFDGLVTDKEGKPLALIGGFKGALSQTSVYPATLVGEAVRIPGAANIWLSHNHPSGDATLSQADERVNSTMVAVFDGTGIDVRGMLAIGDGQFSFVGMNGAITHRQSPLPKLQDGPTIPAIERQIATRQTGEKLDSPTVAKAIAARFYNQAKAPGIVMLNSQLQVVGWVPVDGLLSGRLRYSGGLNALYRAASESNAGAVILAHGGELDAKVGQTQTIGRNIASALAKIEVNPLDIINVKTRTSAAELGETINNGILLSRTGKPSGAGRGMTLAEAESIVKQLMEVGVRKIHVADTVADMPPARRDRILAKDEKGEARGVYFPKEDEVWLVASNLRNADELVFVALHEAFHRGLQVTFGAEGAKLLRQIYATNKRIRDLADGYMERFKIGQEEATNEALADLAGEGKVRDIRGWNRLLKMIRDWLGKIADALGIQLKFTDEMVDDLIMGLTRAGLQDQPAVNIDTTGPQREAAKRAIAERVQAGQSFAEATTDVALSRKPSYTPEQRSALDKAGMRGPKSLKGKVQSAYSRVLSAIQDRGQAALEARQGLLDQFAGLQNAIRRDVGNLPVEQDPYVSARLANGGTSSVMRGLLLHGQAQWAKNGQHLEKKDGTKGLLDILKPLGDDLEAWFGWMIGNRAARLMKEGREHNFTTDDIKALQSLATPEKKAAFQKAALEYAAFKRSVLDVAQEAGLIDGEARKAWDYADYIPFYREVDEKAAFSPTGRRGLAGQSSGVRTLKGGESELNDPMENLLMNFSRLIDASLKNNALRKTVDLLVAHDSDAVHKIGYAMKGDLIPAEQIRKRLVDAGTPQQILGVIPPEAFDGMAKMWAIQAPSDPDVIRLMVNGKPQFYRVNDPVLLASLTSFETVNFFGLGAMRWLKRIFTASVTMTPEFQVRNFIRDSGAAQLITRHGFNPIKSLTGAVSAYRETGGFEQMLFAGASFQSGNVNAADPTSTGRAMRRALRDKGLSAAAADDFMATLIDTPVKFWEKYRHLSESIENANREAVFEAAFRETGSVTQAAYESRDLMDFSLRGSWGAYQTLADVVPFMNARVQGMYRLYRHDPKGFAWQAGKLLTTRLVRYGFLMTMASLALAMANAGEDWYEALPDRDKDTNWHFRINGEHFRVPKPFELGVIFATIPERVMRYALGYDNGTKLRQRLWHNVKEQLSMGLLPWEWQAFKPAVEAAYNHNSFRDAPIEGMADEGKLPHLRYSANTSDTMRVGVGALGSAADAIGLSPKKAEHLVAGYFGQAGMYVLGLSDLAVREFEGGPVRPALRADDLPVVKAFYRVDPPRGTVWESDLYKLRIEVDRIYRSVEAHKREGELEKAQDLTEQNLAKLRARRVLDGAAKRLASLNKNRDRIYNDEAMSAEEKRERLDELLAQRAEIAKQAMEHPAVKESF